MAKGNIGNLLQHFLAIKAVESFVQCLRAADNVRPVTYIDLFSMDVWEQVERNPANAAYRRVIATFENMAKLGDPISIAFLRAWNTRYSPQEVPADPIDRDYPNTAVLLRTVFPELNWRMRLHEIDDQKRARLNEWAQTSGSIQVEGDWHGSGLIKNAAVSSGDAVIVMLDPYKVVREKAGGNYPQGHLPQNELRYLLGPHCLDLKRRVTETEGTPAMVLMFSYSDSQPYAIDRIVRHEFIGWHIDRIKVGPIRVHMNDTYHQGWCAASTSGVIPQAGHLQRQWGKWSSGAS